MYEIFHDKFIDMFVNKLPQFCSTDRRWEQERAGGGGGVVWGEVGMAWGGRWTDTETNDFIKNYML